MNWLTNNWEIILTLIIIPIITWFAGRKHLMQSQVKLSDAEVTGATINNIIANFKVYQDLINDLEERFKHRIEELEGDLEKLKTLNKELRKQIGINERYIKRQQVKIDEYEKLER